MAGVPLNWIPLHEAAEPFLLYETDRYRKCGLTCVDVRGAVDADALLAAMARTFEEFPAARSLLRERRVGARHLLFWAPIPDFRPELRVADLRPVIAGGVEARDAISRHFRERLLRGVDLTREPPFAVHLLRTGDDRYSLVTYQQHVAADGGSLFGFWMRLLAHYEAAQTGRLPDWADGPVAPSSIAAEGNGKPHAYTPLRFARESVRMIVENARRPPASLADRKRPEVCDRTSHRRVLEPDEVARVRAASRRYGCTVNDVLCAAGAVAVERWLREEGRGADRVTVWIPTNLRGRMGTRETATNQASAVMVVTRPEDRRDFAKLSALVRRERTRQMEEGYDVANFLALIKLIGASRVLPFAWRRGVLRKMMEQPCSIMLSNMGVLWPEVKDGRLTGRSFLERAGNLDVLGIDMNFSVAQHEGHGFVIHTFRERLCFNYSILTELMPAAQAERFLDLYLTVLRESYEEKN